MCYKCHILLMTQIKPSHSEDSAPSTVGRGSGELHEDGWGQGEGQQGGMCMAVCVCLEPFLNPFLHFSIRFKTINYVKPKAKRADPFWSSFQV